MIYSDALGLVSQGNHKLDPEQVENIKEKLKDKNLDKKTRNELEKKLKRHEKATGARHSRASKDKFLKRCVAFISPALAELFYPSPHRACDIYQGKPEFCEDLGL